MAATPQTENVYHGQESAGVVVSRPANVICQPLVDRGYFPPLGARFLRNALVDLGVGPDCYPRGMYHLTCEV
jgi:hypothetical protein